MDQTNNSSDHVEPLFRAIMVDDNDAFRSVMRRNLENIGCQVTSTSKASEFLSELVSARSSFDFAIVDIRLPDLDGQHIVSWLRQSEQTGTKCLPVLLTTGYPHDLPEELVFDGISLLLLAKPFRQTELFKAVKQLMQSNALH